MQGVLNVWTLLTDAPVIVQALLIALWLFIALFFPFAWLAADRRAHGIDHSYTFDVSVVALSALVIPIYLWRSRHGARKFLALLGLLLIVIASFFIIVLCSVAAAYAFGLPVWLMA